MCLPDLHNGFSEFVLKQRRQFMHINTVSDWVKFIISELLLHTVKEQGFFFYLHDPLKPWQFYGPKEQKLCVAGSASGWSGVCWCHRSCLSLTDFTSSQREMLNKASIHNNNIRQHWHRCRNSQTPVHCNTNCLGCQSLFLRA